MSCPFKKFVTSNEHKKDEKDVFLRDDIRFVRAQFIGLLKKYNRSSGNLLYLLKILENAQKFLFSLEYLDKNMLKLYCYAIYCQYFRLSVTDIKEFCKMNKLRDSMFKKAIKEMKIYVDGHVSVKWTVGLFTIRDPNRFIL